MEDFTKYKRLIESLENEYFFYSHNLNGQYLYMSPSVEKVLGYTVEQAKQGLVKHMTESEANKKTIETLKKSATGEKQHTFEFELYTKSREIKVIEITESPLYDNRGNVISVEGVAHDITERIKYEQIVQQQNEELKRQDEKLRKQLEELIVKNENIDNLKKELEDRSQLLINIINEIPEKIFLKDRNGKFLLANNNTAAGYGLTTSQIIGKSDADLYSPEKAAEKLSRINEILNSGHPHSYEEGDFNKKDGLIVSTRMKPFKLNDGSTGVLGIQVDISQIKKNEIELKKLNTELTSRTDELKETLQNLKDTQSELVQSEKMRALGNLVAGIAHEINTPVGAINASISNISAALDSSMSNLFDLFTKLTQKELTIFLRIIDMLEKTKPALTSKEKRQYKKDVQQKLEDAGCTSVHSLADLIMYLNLYDKADQVISMLDVDNPEFILKSIKDIYSVRKNTENIKLAINKASKMVFALKKFAHREQNEEKDQADLIENIETVLILHHNQLKQSIEVIKDYEAVPMIACYPDELIQVWTNLVSNALHAMNYAGTLKISIKNQHTHIRVSIKDSGHGIPEELKEKIFLPFFTTKKSGEGTGIGLDIVKRILDKHQAKLELESETGVGTTFHVLLPVN
ncbi:PAS domain S-box protein [Maribellus sp. CM-23]|uniref:PAS domain S-box protein n=1 Tax=Maribellus sp. CM-23 TaxID=2781026 RepID=UPI001F1BEF63|nr:PAS domain S-box protein [Maribellus sp. CM-23]MCE4565285.1 PAS domain S-box protein [Maribellus sp. CM-23]